MIGYREVIQWLIIIALLIFVSRKDTEIVEITLPVRTNTKVITTPVPINEGKKEVVLTNFTTIKIKNPLNDSLVKAYLSQKDSLSRLNSFIDATRQRDYLELLDDSLQTIKVQTRVNGFMREQIITYKTKRQKIKVPVKKTKGLYLGGRVVLPTQIGQRPTLGAEFNIVSPKHILTIGGDLDRRVTVGFGFKLF